MRSLNKDQNEMKEQAAHKANSKCKDPKVVKMLGMYEEQERYQCGGSRVSEGNSGQKRDRT